MKHQVHRSDTKHREVSVETVKHLVLVVVGILLLQEFLPVVLLNVFRTLHDESGTTHCRVADRVFQGGLHQLHHHADDVSRCAELTVVSRCCHLPENILVGVAHRIAVVHIEVVDTLHYLRQRARTLNEEGGILHETTVGGILALVEVLDEYEHILAHDAEHRFGFLVLEHTPAQVVVGNIAVCVGIVPHSFFERRVFHRHPEGICIRLLRALSIVEHFHEEQIRHLFQNRNGIRDASRPEGIPNTINSVFNLSCNHVIRFCSNLQRCE